MKKPFNSITDQELQSSISRHPSNVAERGSIMTETGLKSPEQLELADKALQLYEIGTEIERIRPDDDPDEE